MDIQKIYTDTAADLFRYAMYKTKNKEQAEDVVAETFAKLLDHKGEEIRDTKAWLFTVARNQILNSYKKSNKSAALDEELLIEPSDLADVELNMELLKVVQKKLQKLDQMTQDVILLKVWNEMTFDQISEVVKSNVNNVKALYYRGIEELKKLVNEEEQKKLYTISLPVLLLAVSKLKFGSDLQISSSFLSAVTSKLATSPNLYFNEPVMNGILSKLAALSTTAKVVIGTVCVVGVVGTTAVVTLVLPPKSPEQNPNPEVTSSSSTESTSSSNSSTSSTTTTSAIALKPKARPGKVAYVETNGTNVYGYKGQMWTYDPTAKKYELLVSDPVEGIYGWSPDNKYIAFRKFRRIDTRMVGYLSVVEVATKKVIDTEYRADGVKWTSDSKQMAITTTRGEQAGSAIPSWSLDFVEFPSLRLVNTIKQGIIGAEYNRSVTKGLGMSAPGGSEPYIYDVASNSSTVYSAMGIKGAMVTKWIDDNTFTHADTTGIYVYNMLTKQNELYKAYQLSTGDFFNNVSQVAGNSLYYMYTDYETSNQTYTFTINKLVLNSKAHSVVYQTSAKNSAGLRFMAVDESEDYVIYDSSALLTLMNTTNNQTARLCQSQSCEGAKWSN